ncbi:MAG: ATP-dependent Clp protease proteolytic subunit [Rikenellaceae bacterium]|nr:ATP-dependent Clp protease proteolytic subunit [Rikenellaceae bacterium]
MKRDKFAEKLATPSDRIFNPYIIEERPMNITQLDVYSRLMMDRILFLSGEVCADTMDTLVAQMLFLDAQSHEPIKLYINSGGGECYSGLELVSVMQFIQSPVHTVVLGCAASMAAVIASSGEKGHRKALKYSRFMIHQPSSGVGYSTFRDQQIHLQEMERLKWDLYEVLAQNCGKTKEEIDALCDRDNWMKPEEAIASGFLDSIVESR